MSIPHSSRPAYLKSRTRWRAPRGLRSQTRWRGTPDGGYVVVFRNKRGGWCWCIGGDGVEPVFGPVYRTRRQAQAAVLTAAGLDIPGREACDANE